MVQLKAIDAGINVGLPYYFNSSMVQLKDVMPFLPESLQENFNSSMVQLKEWKRLKKFRIHLLISIPLWYN